MESLTPVSTYISQTAKKRMFSGGSSSSRCKEVEILGISSPPANSSSVSKSSKQKEVMRHEIIDIDMEEDHGNVLLSAGEVEQNGKGKEALSNFSPDHSSLANDGSGSDIRMSDNSTVDDSNSNLFYDEDEWIDTYYDDIVFDDYDVLQSHYDRMDIPPGVEIPFPWLPDCPQNNIETPATNGSTSSLKANSNGAKLSTDLSSSPPIEPKKSLRIRNMVKSLSLKRTTRSARQHPNEKPTSPLELGLGTRKYTLLNCQPYLSSESSSGGSLPEKSGKEPWEYLGKSKRRFHASYLYSGPYDQPPSGTTFSSAVNNHSAYSEVSSGATFSGTVHNQSGHATSGLQTKSPGVGTYTTVWQDIPMTMFEPSMPFIPMNEGVFFPIERASTNHQDGEIPTRVEQKNLDEILQNFDRFKKFDTVEDFSDHHYSKRSSFSIQPPKSWAKRIQEEWKILENDLPDTIFVRVYESRMDLLRAGIIGAEGTPYHDGLFFFDFYFPTDYPNSPPQVQYRSGGLRINPNLYNCGKVCLSLLNTWSGNQKEKWIPGISTMLQVLVSIQALILNANPFFNEPGYADLAGSVSGEQKSLEYNERTFIYSLQTMLYSVKGPPKYFEDFVIGHFCKHAHDILVACQAYLDGAQVGCLVKGRIQAVDTGEKSCSEYFKSSLAEFIPILVDAFSRIGAKDCDRFCTLAQKVDGSRTVAPPIHLFE